jgi:hypothetical protein
VNKTLFAMLTETEKKLLLSAEPAALRDLDEDDLAALARRRPPREEQVLEAVSPLSARTGRQGFHALTRS